MCRFFHVAIFWWIFSVSMGTGQDDQRASEIETEGPVQLLERGRAAFVANDFAAAESALEKFVVDYGRAEEAREAARLHRPLVALCKVGLKKFEEALPWIDESLLDPKIDWTLSDELRFWRGICLMSLRELVPAQRAFGEYWAEERHNPLKRYEALLLFGTLYMEQEFPSEAADFFESQLSMVRAASPEVASRAVVLELYCRLQAGEVGKALDLIRREQEHFGTMTQLISFQNLVLQLGASCLEEERYHDAITCFQRIWPAQKLMDYQLGKIAELKERIALFEARPNSQSSLFQWRAVLRRIERELENFTELEHFDSALRLRLAMAYQGLGRYREAALILEEMLVSMPPDPVVESAALAQVQCWMEEHHCMRAVEAVKRYEEVFGLEGPSLPVLLFLKAEALREDQNHSAARLAYGELVDRFPKDPFAAKAIFMQGFLYLQEEDNEGALYQFEQIKRLYPDSEMVDEADYWTGMAYSFSGLYAEAREHLEAYLERFETPKYRKEALFRIAVATFSLAEYPEAIAKLEQFNEAYPGDPLTDEANLLLGDAWFGEGEREKGLAAYERVRPESGRYFEEAWFKKGNALKQLEEITAMRAHFATFVDDFPESPRLPEAVYWIGWTYLEEGEVERARDIYWETIDTYGDEPERITVSDLFLGLRKVYLAEGEAGKIELLTKLKFVKSSAAIAGNTTLALRAGWAKSLLMDEEEARIELLSVAKWVDPKEHEPLVTVAVAEAQLLSENLLTAKELFTEIRKWHPRAIERDRIYRALGAIATAEGDDERAIEFYERFEREVAASPQLGAVRLKLAELQTKAGREGEARAILTKTLESEGVTAEIKAETLLRLGESFVASQEDEKAIVYFERLYVAYGKFGALNAKAYWQRGQSLERLKLGREALETYEEMLSREDLRQYDEAEKANRRVAILLREFPTAPDLPPESPEKEVAL